MSPEVAAKAAVEALLCLATNVSIVDRGGVPCSGMVEGCLLHNSFNLLLLHSINLSFNFSLKK